MARSNGAGAITPRRSGVRRWRWNLLATLMFLLGLLYLPTAPSSATDAGTIFGSVILPDGSRASGARVWATADGKNVSEHGNVPLVPLGEVVTGPSGTFSFLITPDSTTTPLVNAADSLNVTITAVLEEHADQAAYATAFVTPLKIADATFMPSVDPLTLELEPLPASSSGESSDPICNGGGWKKAIGDPEYKGTKVGELHAWDNMTSSFVYKEAGEHKIDSGYSASGSDWKVSGSESVTKDASLSQGPDGIVGRYGFAQRPVIKYQKYALCAVVGDPFGYLVEAKYASGGFDTPVDVSSKDGPGPYLRNNQIGKMGDYGPGDKVEKDTGASERFEAAAEAFGFRAGAMSVYSQNLKFTWKMGTTFGSPTDMQYHLWGDAADPKSSPTLYAYSGPEPVVITPAAQTTSSGDATWTVKAGQDSAGATTLKMEFGDGLSETRTIPQGSVTSTFTFSHRFISGTGTYRQSVSSSASPTVIARSVTVVR
ncbi:MAG TPA: hypothetical protein VNA57_00060 [Acidimicrobiales bacterium]|nr:hypothetical protein [Acidimicrobiales bacterium]